MALFSSKRIGITIQNSTLMMCESSIDYLGKKHIESINLLRVPKGMIKNGHIIQKKVFRSLLQEGIRTAKPKAMTSKDIIFEVPEENTFQHILNMPSNLSEEQIKEAVVYEVEKMLPFELDQVTWDMKLIPAINNSYTVIFTAIQLDLIQEYYDAFISSGFLPLGFSLHFENVYHAIQPKIKKPSVIIDIQSKYTSLTFLRDKKIISLEQISIGEEDFRKAIREKFELPKKGLSKKIRELDQVDIDLATVEILKKFDKEVTEVLKQFRSQNEVIIAAKNDKDFQKKKDQPKLKTKKKNLFEGFIIGSELATKVTSKSSLQAEKSLLKKIQNKMHGIFDLNTRIKNQLVFLKREDKKHNLNRLFPAAYGASLANYSSRKEYERPMNLLPLMVRSIAVWKETSAWFYLISSFILITSITWLMAFGFQWGSTFAQLRVARANFITLERQLAYRKSTGIEAEIIRANQELKVLTELKGSESPYADILTQIEGVIPVGVQLREISYGIQRDKSLFNITAETYDRKLIIETHQAIKDLFFTNQVIFPPSNLDKRDPFVFSIEFNLRPGLNFNNPLPQS